MRVLSAGEGEVVALGFAPGRPVLVASQYKHGTHAWDLSAADPPLRLSPSWFTSFAFTPDGGRLVRAEGQRRKTIDLTTGKNSTTGPTGPDQLLAFGQTPDGSRVVMARGSYYRPRLSGWRAGRPWEREWLGPEPGAEMFGYPARLALSADGAWVAHFACDRERWPLEYHLVILDAATGREAGRGEYPYGYHSEPVFRPGAAEVVAVRETALLVWPVPGGGKPRVLRNDSRRHFTAAAFTPDGRHLFTTSNDRTVAVWDADAWRPVTRFEWRIGRLRRVAVSPDGALAAAGSDTGKVVVWDVDL